MGREKRLVIITNWACTKKKIKNRRRRRKKERGQIMRQLYETTNKEK